MLKNRLRFKITDNMGNISYMVVDKGRVSYHSAAEAPLALSNIAGSNAAELRFALEDARSEYKAFDAVRKLAIYAKQVIKL